MPDRAPKFLQLKFLLRQSGVTGDSTRRIIDELQDHYFDLVDEAIARGESEHAARLRARQRLGRNESIANAAAHCEALLDWPTRHPLYVALGRSIINAVSLPAAPIYYCASQRTDITRWGVSVGLAIMVTASLLLGLNSILV